MLGFGFWIGYFEIWKCPGELSREEHHCREAASASMRDAGRMSSTDLAFKSPKWPGKGRFGEGFCWEKNITPFPAAFKALLSFHSNEGKKWRLFSQSITNANKKKKMPRTRCGMLFSQHVVLHIWPNTTQHRDGELQRRKSLHMKRWGIGIIPCEPLPFQQIVNHACSRKIRILIPILIADHANPNFIQKLVFWTLKSCWVFFFGHGISQFRKKTRF